jgi:hypothetical protein
MAWNLARQKHKAVERKLANRVVASRGAVVQFNSGDDWKDVGRYEVLGELLWECDK